MVSSLCVSRYWAPSEAYPLPKLTVPKSMLAQKYPAPFPAPSSLTTGPHIVLIPRSQYLKDHQITDLHVPFQMSFYQLDQDFINVEEILGAISDNGEISFLNSLKGWDA